MGWARHGNHVLIIEDDGDIRACIAEALSYDGYTVAEARNGLEGLHEAATRRPDLILLDLMMPTMNGWQFRAAQNRDPALADIPVIVISALATESAASALDGVAALFAKPFDVGTLLSAVERCTAGAREPRPGPGGGVPAPAR
jgi:two-component system, OmpR family, alkaline phosphatase synthesis response regulator PhoP